MDLSDNDLGPVGAESLATVLKTNTTLTNLDLSRNYLGPAGLESLATARKTNTTLTNLNLFDNDLGPLENIYLCEGNYEISEFVQNTIYNAHGNRIRYKRYWPS